MPLNTQYLVKQHNKWSVVVEIPRPLQSAIGARRFKKTLGTESLAVADRLKHQWVSQFKARIEAARTKVPSEITDGLTFREALMTTTGHLHTAPQHYETPAAFAASEVRNHAQHIEREQGPEAAARFMEVARGRSVPLAPLVKEWLAERQTEIGHEAHTQQASALATFMKWAGGPHVTLHEVSTKAKAGLYVSHMKSPEFGRQRSTARRHLSTLKTFWDWLENRTDDLENHWARQKLPFKSAKTLAFPDAMLVQMLRGPADSALHDMMRLALMTGARSNSLASLRAQDATQKEDGWWLHFADKSRAGIRDIPLHADAVPILQRRLEAANGGALFPEFTMGKRRKGSVVSDRFIAYKDMLGIAGYKFHGFRSTFSEQLAGQEIPEWMVQIYIGHSSKTALGSTTGRYIEGGRVDWRKVINALHFAPPVVEAVRFVPPHRERMGD